MSWWNPDPSFLSTPELEKLAKNNNDYSGRFITDKSGRIIGVDEENNQLTQDQSLEKFIRSLS